MPRTAASHRIAASLAIAMCLAVTKAGAGSFQVNPIRIDMTKGATTAAITVRNDGEDAIVVQSSVVARSEEHTSELQSLRHLVCRLLLEKKKERTQRVKLTH